MRAVFIGGCPRSGTTLLGAMLGGHSECITTPESQFKMDCLEAFEKTRRENSGGVRELVRSIEFHPRLRLWGISLNEGQGMREDMDGAGLLRWIVEKYAVARGKPKAGIWIDHTGKNSRYTATLFHHFPEARFVHIVRDGRGVAASALPLDWGPNTIIRAAHWWTEYIAHGLASESYLGPRAIRVSFEKLVTYPDETVRSLCRFLDLEFETNMLQGEGFDVPEFTRHQHQLVGSPPDSGRAMDWGFRLSPRQIEIFESLTGDLLLELGYELKYGSSASPLTWNERISGYAVEVIRGLVLNKIRHRRRLQSSLGA